MFPNVSLIHVMYHNLFHIRYWRTHVRTLTIAINLSYHKLQIPTCMSTSDIGGLKITSLFSFKDLLNT